MREQFSYWRAPNGDRWWRAVGFQVGYYPNGRRPLFSERNGYRRGPLELRLGRRVVTLCRLRRPA